MKVGYLGPEASFTHTATKIAFPNDELVPYHSIPACIKGVDSKEIDLAVVPIENTIEGSVNTTVDYLFHQSTIPVIGEIVLPIHQQLMVAKKNSNDWKKITKILSHPQALAQSQLFISEHFPLAELEPTPSTAYAAHYVSSNPKEKIAAIAPRVSAETYDLKIVCNDIQDIAINRTRFWVLGSKKISLSIPVEEKKMTIAITMPNNMPGALHKALSAFSWREIDLSKIESRPLKTSLGEYFFLIDINVLKPKELLENAITEVRLMGGTVKIFGSYEVHSIHGM
ncbi:prephenate dehydratase [Enterococcus rivorum]|uniref:Prephenate dehydratase n=1 Tax=Enterococcus rivorum TaxID=762845 RepID=A0A1E5KXV5_9ENTE|nr:prephenate dehydratase [Enterococcus rivorum]MBP2099696.1 prephenate dehydratase [Enterococcus rivorum]OEH82721.1 prephenate dehydratase [Enterococcus rivorum]